MGSEGEELPSFQNPQEEVRYWKNLATSYKQKLEESQQELEEYQSHSAELESELEAELEQSQGRCSELRHQVAKLATENEGLKERLSSQSAALEARVDSLEEELHDVRSIKEGLTAYIRQLEQANDDLERAKRATLTSLEDFEMRLNQAIERNAFLESELDEKESLKEMVQRLKDESRDLRQEVIVSRQHHLPTTPDNDLAAQQQQQQQLQQPQQQQQLQHINGVKNIPPAPVDAPFIIDSNKLAASDTACNEDQSGELGKNGETPMTPSARMNALNIVGDLLRKVGMKIQQINKDLSRVRVDINQVEIT